MRTILKAIHAGVGFGSGTKTKLKLQMHGTDEQTSGTIYSGVTLSLVYLVSKIVELVFPFLHTCRSIHLRLKTRKREESKFNVTKLTPQMAPKTLCISYFWRVNT